MERSFFPHVLGRTQDERWLEDLLDHLQHPAFPTVQLFSAMSWRLRRIYMWLYGGVLLAWLSKLETIELPGLSELTGTGGAAGAAAAGARAAGGLAAASVWEVIERAGVGSVPGWLVCAGVAALYAWLVFLTLKPGREHPLANPYRNERLRSGAGRRGTAPAESRADGRRGARAESGAGASAEARGRGRAAA